MAKKQDTTQLDLFLDIAHQYIPEPTPKKRTLSEATKQKIRESNLGKKRSDATRKSIGESKRGIRLSEAHKQKLRELNPGKRMSEAARQKMRENNAHKPMSDATKQKLCEINLGTRHPHSEATKQKLRELNLGKKMSEVSRQKMSESRRFVTGAKNHKWKGGAVELRCKTCAQPFKVKPYRAGEAKYCSQRCRKNDPDKKTKLHERIRKSPEYRAWRLAVFTRDNFTCQFCGARGKDGVELNADHIKAFATYPELRFDVENGRTLCRPCHLTTETFGVWKGKRHEPDKA